MDDYTDDIEIFPMDEDPPSVDTVGYETDDYFYYYDDYGDPVDDTYHENPDGPRSRGRSRAGGNNSSSSGLFCPPSLSFLFLCWLVGAFTERTFLLASFGSMDRSFVS